MSPSRAIVFSLGLAMLCGCLQTDRETERTKSQLAKMAKDVGADEALASLGKGYQEKVAPIVAMGTAQVETAESLAAARETGAEVIAGARSFGSAVSEKASGIAEYFPESEAELVGWIDGYTNSFAGWLRDLGIGGFGGFSGFGFGSSKFSIGSSARKPHAPNSVAPLPKGPIVSSNGGPKSGNGTVSFSGLRR